MHATKIAIVSNCDQLHESAVFFLFTNSCDFAWTWNNVTWFALNTCWNLYIFIYDRLNEGNMSIISKEIEQIYMQNSRNGMLTLLFPNVTSTTWNFPRSKNCNHMY